MSVIYRAWAGTRLRELLEWQDLWVSDILHGYRSRHGPEHVWWNLALKIKRALIEGTDLAGMPLLRIERPRRLLNCWATFCITNALCPAAVCVAWPFFLLLVLFWVKFVYLVYCMLRPPFVLSVPCVLPGCLQTWPTRVRDARRAHSPTMVCVARSCAAGQCHTPSRAGAHRMPHTARTASLEMGCAAEPRTGRARCACVCARAVVRACAGRGMAAGVRAMTPHDECYNWPASVCV